MTEFEPSSYWQNGSRHHNQIFIIFEGSTVLKKPEENIGQKFTANTYQSPRVQQTG